MKIFLLMSIVGCLFSCQMPVTSYSNVCRSTNATVRPCTPPELSMIDGMRALISQIRILDVRTISSSFVGHGDLNDARVILFGERHTEIIAQIETLGAINALSQRGDYLLLEGADRKRKFVHNCALSLIFALYTNWQWESMGQRYTLKTLKDKNDWLKKKNFKAMLLSTLDSYDAADLNLAQLTCGFWDDNRALADTMVNDVTINNFTQRNRSMVQSIDTLLPIAKRIFIITGFLHMPMGDHMHSKSLNARKKNFPRDKESYYELFKQPAHARSRFILESTAGTTEPIYRYLTKSSFGYGELIHGRLLYP